MLKEEVANHTDGRKGFPGVILGFIVSKKNE